MNKDPFDLDSLRARTLDETDFDRNDARTVEAWRRSARAQQRYPDATVDSYNIGKEFEKFARAIVFERFGRELTPSNDRRTQCEVGDFIEGVEVKYDERSVGTGRLSIEVESRNSRNSDWNREGIMKCIKAKLYLQGNYDFIFVFPAQRLRRWAQSQLDKGIMPDEFNGTMKRLWLPMPGALSMCRYYERIGIQSFMQEYIDALNKILRRTKNSE